MSKPFDPGDLVALVGAPHVPLTVESVRVTALDRCPVLIPLTERQLVERRRLEGLPPSDPCGGEKYHPGDCSTALTMPDPVVDFYSVWWLDLTHKMRTANLKPHLVVKYKRPGGEVKVDREELYQIRARLSATIQSMKANQVSPAFAEHLDRIDTALCNAIGIGIPTEEKPEPTRIPGAGVERSS